MNFIKFNDRTKLINLDNVSNISIDHHKNRSGKVIFNFNYSVKIFNDKYTPDYVYWKFGDSEELKEMMTYISDYTGNLRNWITLNDGRKINLIFVSSVVEDFKNKRIIFNLNYNISHPHEQNKLTSDFVFIDFKDKQEYSSFLEKFYYKINLI